MEELRPGLEPDRVDEHREEDRLDERADFEPGEHDPDQHADQECSRRGAEREWAEPHPAHQIPDPEREEQRDLGGLVQDVGDEADGHGRSPSVSIHGGLPGRPRVDPVDVSMRNRTKFTTVLLVRE
jgi:hypothetical protein